ncbi:MAG: Uma2 family endonuclease [Nostoc sp. DedSLP03]|uniref:Uma2 family endonuclease n=1 Tax=Nostoc sp. DedSLP03 TaxID=3075400 RepID=UPI002AD3B9D4|nr:Uma2 family endonuclease [Nostoc sp. DedSLP03]MDZ7965015.1 Uma2 family endonuclease [Nostoc sp. DedSLP03]
MTSLLPSSRSTEVFYPSSDGEPLAESYVHLCALLATLEVLRQYLLGRQATVLSNQFLYYAQGFPRLRIAPDVMVIFNVAPGGRDNYKIWEEGQVPVIIFEMTSEGTKNQDTGFKKTLYEQLGVLEYWLFDPKGEWIKEQLQGYRLRGEVYEPITDSPCEPLQLRLQVEEQLIGFYREDTKEKLLIPEELAEALKQERLAREQAQEQAKQAESQVQRLKEHLRSLGVDPDTI